jgi:hypothetical protein
MPPYYAMPHTPLQRSGGPGSAHPHHPQQQQQTTPANHHGQNYYPSSQQQQHDSFYNTAPLSVPTPSKSSSTSMLAAANSLSHQSEQQQQQQQQPPLAPPQSQVSFNLNSSADMMSTFPKSVGSATQAKSSASALGGNRQRPINFNASVPSSSGGNKLNTSSSNNNNNNNNNNPMSKLATYVLNMPVPPHDAYKHERNQRFVVLYGFGARKQEALLKLRVMTRSLKALFAPSNAIDLNDPPAATTTATAASTASTSKL